MFGLRINKGIDCDVVLAHNPYDILFLKGVMNVTSKIWPYQNSHCNLPSGICLHLFDSPVIKKNKEKWTWLNYKQDHMYNF